MLEKLWMLRAAHVVRPGECGERWRKEAGGKNLGLSVDLGEEGAKESVAIAAVAAVARKIIKVKGNCSILHRGGVC